MLLPRNVKASLLITVLIGGLLLTSACGGGGGGAYTPPSGADLTGRWRGTWRSSLSGTTGTVTAELRQRPGEVTGTISMTDCLSGGTVTGSPPAGNIVYLLAGFRGGQILVFEATLVGNELSGEYAVEPGPCPYDLGSMTMRRQ